MFSKIFCGNKKIFLIFAVLFLNFLLVSPALAAVNNNTNYVPLVNIPGVNTDAGVLTYLSGLYNFLISVVGILAMAVIIYGGMRYLTSAGNPSSVEEAKDAITSAVTGLILALLSWLILSTINPDILVLKSVGMSGAGTYSYADSKNICVANATGTGTAANPCVCIDGKKVYAKSGATLVPTVLTLTVSPNPGSSTPPGNNITLSGKLTDSAGKGVSGSIKINKVNTALNASTTFNATSGTDGSFTANYTATCAVTDQVQAVYAGDATYAGSSSTPVSLVINGMTVCTTANYASSPATATITSAGGGSACQSICSDTTLSNDGAYHCLKADLRAGKTEIDRTSKRIWGKVGEKIFFDGATYNISDKPIVRYEMDFDNNFTLGVVADSGCNVVTNGCSTFPFPVPWTTCDGVTGNEFTYNTAGTYKAWLSIYDSDCNNVQDWIDVTIENL